MNEDILQAEIFRFYHNTYCTKFNELPHVIFSVPNGGWRTKSESMKLKATGVIAGVSDLIIIQPNRIIFIELKTDKGVQSNEQKAFEQKVKLLGFEYFLIRSFEEFKKRVCIRSLL